MRSVFRFFVLTYIVSWVLWVAAAATLRSAAGFHAFNEVFDLPGAFAPAIVALVLAAREEGGSGISTLLRRTVQWSAAAQWYVFALAYMAAIKLVTAVIIRTVSGTWPAFGREAPYIMAIAIAFSTPVQAGEEIGWRGYALPRLSRLFGLPNASLILGVVSACWHLPFFFISGTDKSGQSFPVYILYVTALSVASAWLYWRTDGSLLLMMLMHAAVNNTKDIVPSAMPGATNPFSVGASKVEWISLAILWICATYFLVRMRGIKPNDGHAAGRGFEI